MLAVLLLNKKEDIFALNGMDGDLFVMEENIEKGEYRDARKVIGMHHHRFVFYQMEEKIVLDKEEHDRLDNNYFRFREHCYQNEHNIENDLWEELNGIKMEDRYHHDIVPLEDFFQCQRFRYHGNQREENKDDQNYSE